MVLELRASVVTSRLRVARLALPFLLGLVLILAAWVVVPRASAAPPGVFQPPHSDYGVDTDSDGLFNALVVQVNMSIAQAGDYLISAYLHDASYRLSTGNSTQAHLDPGPNSVTVALDGWRINVSGVDGPYSVELSLYERTYGLSDTGVHTTAEYSHLAFESPPAYLVPPFADAGVDTNGNGRFDDLAVDVNLTVEQTDYYGLYGNLRELDVSASTSWRSYEPGSYSVQLRFDGIAINEKGIDGPYVVDLTLYMRDWQIGFNNDTTGPYRASDFESPPPPPPRNLGTLPGGRVSFAYAINDAGQVVGVSEGGSGAFLWQNGVMTDLGTLGGASSSASGINQAGQIVGISNNASGESHAFMWDNGTMTDLGTLPGDYYSEAYGINDAAQVVGYSFDSGRTYHAFLWQAGTMTDLGNLGVAYYTVAWAINDAGQVVGGSSPAYGVEHAFLWSGGGMQDLGTLGGAASEARAINDEDEVVGWSLNASGAAHAFLWQNGTMTDLGTLPGGYASYAYGINDAGQVVGISEDSSGLRHAFLWSAGTMTDLGTLGGCCSEARGTNDAHQVVGGSATTAGFTNAVLWTVPGPHAQEAPASLAGEPGSASARPHPVGGGTGGTIPAARSKLDAFGD
ncbi:MAG: hypothetical protein E6K61_05510 [Nitrospirae bacterium]|nr:MAG: hypothetical protein E6K61_05510 [Nitrospirota bacterium]